MAGLFVTTIERPPPSEVLMAEGSDRRRRAMQGPKVIKPGLNRPLAIHHPITSHHLTVLSKIRRLILHQWRCTFMAKMIDETFVAISADGSSVTNEGDQCRDKLERTNVWG